MDLLVGRHGKEEPPVARAELHQMANSLLKAMERVFNECMPIDGRRAPRLQYEESSGQNSDAGDGFHDRLRDSRGGGRLAGHHGRNGG